MVSRASQISAVSGVPYGAASFSTGSFTPPDSSLLTVFVGGASESDISGSDFTISGGGLTWSSPVASVGTSVSSYWSKLQVFVAQVATGSSMTVTVDHAVTMQIWHVQVISETGYNTSTPTGATGSDTALEDAGNFTLSTSPASTSEVIAARFLVPNEVAAEAATPGSGWTEIYDIADATGSGWGGLETQARGASTSASVDWIDTTVGTTAFSNIGLAVEILDAGGGGDTLFVGGGLHFM